MTLLAQDPRRYMALCPHCGDERKLSRSVVLTGRIPVCQGCKHYMNVYSLDPRPPAPPRPLIAREAE